MPHEGGTNASTIALDMREGARHGARRSLIKIDDDDCCDECTTWWRETAALLKGAIAQRRASYEELTREIRAIAIVDAGAFVPLLGPLTSEESALVLRLAAREDGLAKVHALAGDIAAARQLRELTAGDVEPGDEK